MPGFRSRGGVFIRHCQLKGDNHQFMRVHLDENGLEIFLSGLHTGIEQALFLLGWGGGGMVGVSELRVRGT